MKLPLSGLTGPFLAFGNAVQQAFDGLRSPVLHVVASPADLPNAHTWDRRQVIVRDIDGGGNTGLATALDGQWFDQDWSAV